MSSKKAVVIDDIPLQIDRLRERLHGLTSELNQVDDAPKAKAQALRDMESWVDMMGAPHDPQVYKFVNEGSSGPSDLLSARPGGIEQFLAWALADIVKARLAGEIDKFYATHRQGLPSDARAAAVEKMQAEIFALEVEEERLISEAEISGLTIARRGDANPAAILEATIKG